MEGYTCDSKKLVELFAKRHDVAMVDHYPKILIWIKCDPS
jgi:hypothetical protein